VSSSTILCMMSCVSEIFLYPLPVFSPYNLPLSLIHKNHIPKLWKKIISYINHLLFLAIRELAKHLIGHVGAVEAFWKMRHNVNNVSQHVTWQLMSSVMCVLFVKRVVSSVVGYLILVLMLNRYCLWFPQPSRPWDVELEDSPSSWKCYSCVCHCCLYNLMLNHVMTSSKKGPGFFFFYK